MVPEQPIVTINVSRCNSMLTGDLEPGEIYNIIPDPPEGTALVSEEFGRFMRVMLPVRPSLPIKAPKPWEKWTQHPKSPRSSHFKKARRQPGT